MITKNSVVKFQNLGVNHKSRPVKSNSGPKNDHNNAHATIVIVIKKDM